MQHTSHFIMTSTTICIKTIVLLASINTYVHIELWIAMPIAIAYV